MIDIWVVIAVVFINALTAIVSFGLGAYVTAKGFKNELPLERKPKGRVVNKTTAQKQQILRDRVGKVKTEGHVTNENWGALDE